MAAVVHSASVGISGAENLPAYDDETEEVNVGGTRNVLSACSAHGVRALLYTSSVNVCYSCNLVPTFDGRENELPYQSLSKHTDHYSRTKQISEELVLTSTDKLVANGNVLRTAAIRPGFIYGPYEQKHVPRMIVLIEKGYTTRAGFAFSTLQDMVHVDNAVQGHMRALDCLLDENEREKVSGQAYFVTDGNPANTFLFFMRHLIVAIKGPSARPPTLEIPILVVLAIAWFFTIMGMIMGKRFVMPFFGVTVSEVDKVHHNIIYTWML